MEPEELLREAYGHRAEAQELQAAVARSGMLDGGVELARDDLEEYLRRIKEHKDEAKRLEDRAAATKRARARQIPEVVGGGDLVGDATERQKEVARVIGYVTARADSDTPTTLLIKEIKRRKGQMVDWMAVVKPGTDQPLPPGSPLCQYGMRHVDRGN